MTSVDVKHFPTFVGLELFLVEVRGRQKHAYLKESYQSKFCFFKRIHINYLEKILAYCMFIMKYL